MMVDPFLEWDEKKWEGGKRQTDGDKHCLSHGFAWNKHSMIYQKQCFVIPSAAVTSGKVPFLTIIYSVSNWQWKVENASLGEQILPYFCGDNVFTIYLYHDV